MVTVENYDKNGKRIDDLTKVKVDVNSIPGLQAAIINLSDTQRQSASLGGRAKA